MKWFPTQREGMKAVKRIEKKYKDATLMDGFVGGYKTGYVAVTKSHINGWKLKTIT